MPRGKKVPEIPHHVCKDAEETIDFYVNHPLARKLKPGEIGLVRVRYPPGLFDGYYVFAALSKHTCIELEMPRVIVAISSCSEADNNYLRDAFNLITQPEGPTERFNFATHTIVKSFKAVKEFYKKNPVFANSEGYGVLILNFPGDLPHPDYENCYVFTAVNLDTGEELDILHVLLSKSNRTKKELAEIDKIGVIQFVPVGDPDEPDEEPEPDGPGSNGEIN